MTTKTATTWPQHPDGTNKRVGEMTADERREVIAASKWRFEVSRSTSTPPRKRQITGLSALRVGAVDGKEF